MKTNKTFKKIASAATAAILASCAMMPMAVTNVEAAQITISGAQTSGHEFEVYQIFKGTLSSDGKLSNIQWGDGVNSATIQTKVQEISAFSSCDTAEKVAEKLALEQDDSEVAKAFAKVVGENLGATTSHTATSSGSGTNYTYTLSISKMDGSTDISNGYYLVKNKNNNLSGEYDAHTNYIVEVAGTGEAEVKTALPTIEKKVQDINDSTQAAVEDTLQDSADYDIGDKVPFTITGTLPDNYATYSKYKYMITDTLSKGLKYDSSQAEVSVTVGGTPVSVTPSAQENGDGTTTLTFTIDDLKTAASSATKDSKVVVKYNAVLDTDAVIGEAGNPNEVYLEYSNDPYDTDNTPSLGKTPTDLVKVFTYEAVITKVDANKQKLKGARFKLLKHNGTDYTIDCGTYPATNVDNTQAGNQIDTFTFTGLDDGKYKLVEIDAPEGYNKLSDEGVLFEIEATHDEESDNPKLNTLTVTPDSQFSADKTSGQITADVENKAGSVLPSTGGIGTTPFYIGGGVLVAAAGVYIIVRKRMKNNDNEK